MASKLRSKRASSLWCAAPLLLVNGLGACTLTLDSTELIQACVRNSDCPTGLYCSVGTCLPPILDGGPLPTDASAREDAGSETPPDSGTTPPPMPPQMDGGETDAGGEATDAGGLAADAGMPDAAAPTVRDAGSAEGADAAIDAGLTEPATLDAGGVSNDSGSALQHEADGGAQDAADNESQDAGNAVDELADAGL